MCITFFHIPEKDSKIPFFVLFNRDESGLRKTDSLHSWCEDENIIGGRDSAFGGTWFGVNKKTYHIAFLTNLDDPQIELQDYQLNKRSRGNVIKTFLESNFSERYTKLSFIEEIIHNAHEYNPFNLVIGNIKTLDMYYIDIYHKKFTLLPKGEILGFSNNLFRFSEWEKVEDGKKKLENIKEDIVNKNIDKIIEIMQCNDNYGIEEKSKESSIFIDPYFNDEKLKMMHTVSTTIFIVDKDEVFFYEFENKTRLEDIKKMFLKRKGFKLANYLKFILFLRKINYFEINKWNRSQFFSINK